MHTRRFLYLFIFVLVLLSLGLTQLRHPPQSPPSQHVTFDGKNAYGHVIAQVSFGPRITDTQGSRDAGDYIAEQLRQTQWSVEFQNFTYRDAHARNVIGRANLGKGPIIILGAHYDTRRWADQDPTHPRDPVPGANDGASGVAVLLELANTLDLHRIHHEIWLVFFDAEDNGGSEGWEWIAGSTYIANNLPVRPQAMILLDMIGDIDQKIYFDGNSDRALSEKIWSIAANLGYSRYFLPQVRWFVLDDHVPFAQQGVPAIDIIDLDYEFWHTTADTADKVSPDSLERVGRTIQAFLETIE